MTRPPFARTLVAVALAGGASLALAQQAAPPAPPATPRAAFELDIERLTRDAERLAREHADHAASFRWNMLAEAGDFDLDTDGPSFAFIAREFGSAREIVKNAPYTAEAVNEVVQTLADGNRIVRRTATLVARDAYGRTRQERKGGTVYVFDPIDNKSYALNPDRKTAVRIPRAPTLMPPPSPMAPTPPTPAAIAPLPPVPPIPPVAAVTPSPTPGVAPRAATERVVVKRSADGRDIEVTPGRVVVKRSTPDGKELEDVRVEVVRVGREGRGMFETPFPTLALPLLPRGKGDTQSLGTREFEGVKADGTMTTHTIPAGEIGNEKAIVITSERWFSPELHVVVYAKNSDPRTGDTIYRLANLRRGEPPPEWFRVPADYRVRKP